MKFISNKPKNFYWEDKSFYLDEEPLQLFSGEIHYTRVPKEYWKHRFAMAKAAGLNTICTYIFWNAHQPRENGDFDFSGNLDIAEFIKLAGEMGLLVLIRPGPYVCSEWDLGGLPAWLLAKQNIRLRCSDPTYLDAVAPYIKAVAGEIRELQCSKGGPIVMLQIENEYGSYGSDKKYLKWLCDAWRAEGIDIPFFTSDGATHWHLDRGTCDDKNVLATINLGSNLKNGFKVLAGWRDKVGRNNDDAPDMIGEYWNGWFAHWGSSNNVDNPKARDSRARKIKGDLEWIRDTGRSISLYMFHGGTNFGFWAGANHYLDQGYKPDVTSYDNTAPVNEHGAPTVKFDACRDVFGPQAIELPDVPETPPLIEIDPIEMQQCAPLFENLQPNQVCCIDTAQVKPMECYNQQYGLILYRHQLIPASANKQLSLHDLRDEGYIFIDGKLVTQENHIVTGDSTAFAKKRFSGKIIDEDGEICIETKISDANPNLYPVPVNDIFEDFKGQAVQFSVSTATSSDITDQATTMSIPEISEKGARLDILVVNHGRVNYGMAMQDETKGITRKVVVDPAVLMGWKVYPLPLDNDYLDSLHWRNTNKLPENQPVFYRATFSIDELGDTFLDTRGLQKGFIWVNGHNLGRFWSIGPQQTLYLPAPWLKIGDNEIIILTMLGEQGLIKGVKTPIWNQLQLD